MYLTDLTLAAPGSDRPSNTAAIRVLKSAHAPIPTLPTGNHSPVTWNAWSANLGAANVHQHAALHPDHEVIYLTNDDLIILDTDLATSLPTLDAIEPRQHLRPTPTINTPSRLAPPPSLCGCDSDLEHSRLDALNRV